MTPDLYTLSQSTIPILTNIRARLKALLPEATFSTIINPLSQWKIRCPRFIKIPYQSITKYQLKNRLYRISRLWNRATASRNVRSLSTWVNQTLIRHQVRKKKMKKSKMTVKRNKNKRMAAGKGRITSLSWSKLCVRPSVENHGKFNDCYSLIFKSIWRYL